MRLSRRDLPHAADCRACASGGGSCRVMCRRNPLRRSGARKSGATMLAWVRGRPFPNAVAFRNVAEAMRTPLLAGQRQLLEPTLYTLEGRQGGNLRRKCASVLSRKAKPPGDRGKGRPFFAGAADTPHPAPQGGQLCVASWWSMTTCAPGVP